jgi:ADP-ribose pyrophosphatase YjhB (NUDIX family)
LGAFPFSDGCAYPVGGDILARRGTVLRCGSAAATVSAMNDTPLAKPDPRAGPSIKTIPEGDNRTRLQCADCGYIEYANPKVVVGAICTWEDRFLMCRRAIPPRRGYWTIPAGFLELNETTLEGAAREVMEEAGARVEIGKLVGVFEIPRISQIYMFYAAAMLSVDHQAGIESEAVELMSWEEIPWDDLAFPSIGWGLQRFREGGPPAIYQLPPG